MQKIADRTFVLESAKLDSFEEDYGHVGYIMIDGLPMWRYKHFTDVALGILSENVVDFADNGAFSNIEEFADFIEDTYYPEVQMELLLVVVDFG